MNPALPLVEQLKNLEQLQEIDLKIDAIKRNQSSLPAGLRQIDENLYRLRTAADAKKNAIDELEKGHRQAQAALELNKDRLSRSTSKLEQVQNSQEFQAASKEIEQLKKLSLSLEEQGVKSKEDLAGLEKEFAQIGEQIAKLKSERDALAATVSGQESQFQSDISSLMSERERFTVHVERRLLAQYDRVRNARSGLGIVPTVGGRCKGCNMVVPPQLYNEVYRGSTLHSCPSCNRILYAPRSGVETEAGNG